MKFKILFLINLYLSQLDGKQKLDKTNIFKIYFEILKHKNLSCTKLLVCLLSHQAKKLAVSFVLNYLRVKETMKDLLFGMEDRIIHLKTDLKYICRMSGQI